MKTKLIGLYELITGIFGFILSFVKLITNLSTAISSTNIFFTFLLALILFGILAYSGYALLNNKKGGVKYSIWIQAVQSIGFTLGGIHYLFSSAAFFYITFQSGLKFNYSAQPIEFEIYRLSGPAPLTIHIFILPILFILLLTKRK